MYPFKQRSATFVCPRTHVPLFVRAVGVCVQNYERRTESNKKVNISKQNTLLIFLSVIILGTKMRITNEAITELILNEAIVACFDFITGK